MPNMLSIDIMQQPKQNSGDRLKLNKKFSFPNNRVDMEEDYMNYNHMIR